MIDRSALRAARLALVNSSEDEADKLRREEHAIAAKRRQGHWRWRPIGDELQFRSKTLPTLRIDVLRPEARDLMLALAAALNEKAPPSARMTKREKAEAIKARNAWKRSNAAEHAAALRRVLEDFAETGGW